MFDFLLELLFMCIEPFLEFLLELALAGLLDLLLRAVVRFFGTSHFANRAIASVGYFFLGASAGGLSLIIFPHALVHSSRLHGINLLVSPIATGVAMFLVGAMLSRRGKAVTRIEGFGFGFAVALGVALVRYLFAT
jgi:hypothetical protein